MKLGNQDLWTYPEDALKIKQQFLAIESYRDFIGWLFEEEIDWMTQSEAWEKFEKWESKLNESKKVNP